MATFFKVSKKIKKEVNEFFIYLCSDFYGICNIVAII